MRTSVRLAHTGVCINVVISYQYGSVCLWLPVSLPLHLSVRSRVRPDQRHCFDSRPCNMLLRVSLCVCARVSAFLCICVCLCSLSLFRERRRMRSCQLHDCKRRKVTMTVLAHRGDIPSATRLNLASSDVLEQRCEPHFYLAAIGRARASNTYPFEFVPWLHATGPLHN